MEKNEIKKLVAYTAADTLIKSGMKVGLGSGSTAIEVVRRIAQLKSEQKLQNLMVVPTSLQTKLECLTLGIPITTLADPALKAQLDLTIDGADEIDPQYRLIKGHGGALLSEKITAYASVHFAVVADFSKIVDKLGIKFAVPVEVVPEAQLTVSRQLESLGAKVNLLMATNFAGPVYTEHGNLLLHAKFKSIEHPDALEKSLSAIPGVVESGLFCRQVNHIFVGTADGKVDHIQT
ncbi:MAG: ribose-5-phosphate isomerase RpiA [Spirochaetales bacterium]|nr:ribose-5-phosphate isomerase RpiA [Spirochaetales bacterium]